MTTKKYKVTISDKGKKCYPAVKFLIFKAKKKNATTNKCNRRYDGRAASVRWGRRWEDLKMFHGNT